MDDKQQQVHVTLNPNGVIAPLYQIMGQSASNVLFGLRLIDSVETPIHPMEIQTEDTFISYQPSHGQEEDIALSKENFKLWTFQKGFEDLIKGINLTLIEAYFYNTIVLKKNDFKTFQDLQQEIATLKETAARQSLPGLFSKVKPGLTGPLNHELEINSLNKVRNCLVHRNGLVTEIDINDTANNQLKVGYVRMKMFYDKDGSEVEVKKYDVVEGGTSLKMRMVKEDIIFNLGDRVKFTYQQFNSLTTTCFAFGSDLVSKLSIIPTTTNV